MTAYGAHTGGRAVVVGGVAGCGRCERRLQALDQWRCPWVACRIWLRATGADPEPGALA